MVHGERQHTAAAVAGRTETHVDDIHPVGGGPVECGQDDGVGRRVLRTEHPVGAQRGVRGDALDVRVVPGDDARDVGAVPGCRAELVVVRVGVLVREVVAADHLGVGEASAAERRMVVRNAAVDDADGYPLARVSQAMGLRDAGEIRGRHHFPARGGRIAGPYVMARLGNGLCEDLLGHRGGPLGHLVRHRLGDLGHSGEFGQSAGLAGGHLDEETVDDIAVLASHGQRHARAVRGVDQRPLRIRDRTAGRCPVLRGGLLRGRGAVERDDARHRRPGRFVRVRVRQVTGQDERDEEQRARCGYRVSVHDDRSNATGLGRATVDRKSVV